jgi:hypothetical protein
MTDAPALPPSYRGFDARSQRRRNDAPGERELGVAHVVDAYRIFRRLGARPLSMRAAETLAEPGEPVDRRLGKRALRDLEWGGSRVATSSPAARGGRPEEPRDRPGLVLSPRTVDMHVRNVPRKLDCRTRTHATTKALERGLLDPLRGKASVRAATR